jgi:hypothetical protein
MTTAEAREVKAMSVLRGGKQQEKRGSEFGGSPK